MIRTATPISFAILIALPATAAAEITITKAEHAAGYTLIRGEVERPLARVTLDERYTTLSDKVGRFSFRVRYLPEDCIVNVRAGRDTHPVTIGNCLLPGKGVAPRGRISR